MPSHPRRPARIRSVGWLGVEAAAASAGCQPGDRVVVAPTISTEDAKAKFSNVEEVKPYLRFADAPNA